MKEEVGFLWYKPQRPIVVMPEGTKTNGLGVLNIERGIIKMFTDASTPEQNLRLHTLRFDHLFNYRPSYNTTDELGISNCFWALM